KLSCTLLTGQSCAQMPPLTLHPEATLLQVLTGKARCMPLPCVSLHVLFAMYRYQNETHQNLILRGNASTAFLRTRHFLWSSLARILPLQERITSGARGAREGKPYAI